MKKSLSVIALLLLLCSPVFSQTPDLNETRRFAEQGIAGAQYNLGLMYATGRGVPQNHARAYLWFSMAAAQGNEGASEMRDLTSEKLTTEALNNAQQLARRCFDSGFKDCD